MLNKVAINTFAKVGSGQGAPQKDSDFSNEGYPFIRAGSLGYLLSGGDEQSLPRINSDIAKKYKLKLFQPNTIVFAKSGMSSLKGRIYKLKNPSYVVNHLATLDLSAKVCPDYILYALRYYSPVRLIINSAYPSLNLSAIESYEIPLPNTLDDQKRIAKILSQCETLIQKRKLSISLLDELLKSTFLKMFGESSLNKMSWNKVPIKQFGDVITGNTPPRNNQDNYSSKHIEWIKTDNIQSENMYITEATEYLSETGLESARTVSKGALLVACIAGSIESIGRAALTDRTVSFNQQINAIQPDNDVEPLFLYWSFIVSKKYIQRHATKGMKKILTKGEFEKIKMIKPPHELQTQFSIIANKTVPIKKYCQDSLKELENLYGSISQRAFNGELDLSKVDISDMEDSKKKDLEAVKQELEPIGEEFWDGKYKIQKYDVNIDEIIKIDFAEKIFSFKDLEDAIIDRGGVYMPYENIKQYVFTALNGNDASLEQIFDETAKKIVFKVKK